MKKNGDGFFFLAAASVAILSFILINHKGFDDKKQPKADFIQYGNRFIEFFESEDMQQVQQMFNDYLDMGIKAEDAFEMTIGRVND